MIIKSYTHDDLRWNGIEVDGNFVPGAIARCLGGVGTVVSVFDEGGQSIITIVWANEHALWRTVGRLLSASYLKGVIDVQPMPIPSSLIFYSDAPVI
jgi:hypothetical protein